MRTYHVYRIEYSRGVEFVADVSAEDAVNTFYNYIRNKYGFANVNTAKALFPVYSVTEG